MIAGTSLLVIVSSVEQIANERRDEGKQQLAFPAGNRTEPWEIAFKDERMATSRTRHPSAVAFSINVTGVDASRSSQRLSVHDDTSADESVAERVGLGLGPSGSGSAVFFAAPRATRAARRDDREWLMRREEHRRSRRRRIAGAGRVPTRYAPKTLAVWRPIARVRLRACTYLRNSGHVRWRSWDADGIITSIRESAVALMPA